MIDTFHAAVRLLCLAGAATDFFALGDTKNQQLGCIITLPHRKNKAIATQVGSNPGHLLTNLGVPPHSLPGVFTQGAVNDVGPQQFCRSMDTPRKSRKNFLLPAGYSYILPG